MKHRRESPDGHHTQQMSEPTPREFNLLSFLRAEKYILAGLGCALLLLACLALAFIALWQRFPGGGKTIQVTQLASDPTPQAATLIFPSPVLSTQTPFVATTPAETTPTLLQLPGRIAYVCFLDGYDQICIMDPEGGAQTRLTTSQATDFYPSLAPDGSAIVFSSQRDGRFEIYNLDLASGSQRRLTDQVGSAFAPEISPDGRLIAFTNELDGTQSIWIMNRDGTDPKPLTDGEGDDIDPTWSPDGQLIAFASTRSGQGNQLHVIDLVSREIRAVTSGVPDIGGRSDWSPDGSSLAFYAGPQDMHEIFFIDADGTNLRQMTIGGDNLGPSYSPDGRWIVFTSYRTGNNEIFRMRDDGQGIVQLTNNDHADWQPRWGP